MKKSTIIAALALSTFLTSSVYSSNASTPDGG
ncbi:hypothetical protein SAMN05421821_10857, partial [Mucilaginibacter lappiensis]